MTLENFESHINPVILQRGFEMIENQCVTQMDEMEDGHYRFDINGTTDDYEVNIYLDANNKKVEDYDCDCPYDRGPICKHIVAALYYLRDSFSETKIRSPKDRSAQEEIETIISKAPSEDILKFVVNYYVKDKVFRSKMSSAFSDFIFTDEYKKYSHVIKSVIKNGSGRHGFIEYREMRKVGSELYGIIQEAKEWINSNNLSRAVAICKVMLPELIDLTLNCDDSDGYCSNLFYATMETMVQVSESSVLTNNLRNEIIEFLTGLYNSGKFSSWDWDSELFDAILKFSRGYKDLSIYRNMIEAKLTKASKYEKEKLHEKMLELIQEVNGKKSANEYMHAHLDITSFREKLIEDAIERKDYAFAKEIATQGIKKDQKEAMYGLVAKWNKYLLKIALITHDKKTTLKMLYEEILVQWGAKKETLDQLKSEAGEIWPKYKQDLINEGRKRATRSFGNSDLLENVYRYEEMWEEMFQLFYNRQYPRIDKLIGYQSYFSKSHAKELSNLYLKSVKEHLRGGSATRDIYHSMALLLLRVSKLGFAKEAQETAEELRTKNPRLRALHDELKKVGF